MHILRKILTLEKKINSCIIFGHWAKICQPFVENLQQFCQNSIPRVQKKTWGTFFLKKFYFLILSDIEVEHFRPFSETFLGVVVKFAFFVSRGIFWGEVFFRKKYKFWNHFWTLHERYSAFWWQFLGMVDQLHSKCFQEHLVEKNYS